MDQAFTYRLPMTLRHRAQRGCRITVPFGSRKLTGVIVAVHNNAPSSRYAIKEALKLVDEEPVLDEELLKLGAWIASYYCAPVGEVYRGMMPLSGETRKGKVYSLTDGGRDVARQLILGDAETDPSLQLLRLLETRPLTEAYLKTKFENAKRLLQGLEKKGFVEVEDVEADRDPLRISAERLRVELILYPSDGKFPKPERELLSLKFRIGQSAACAISDCASAVSSRATATARSRLSALA